MESKEIDTTAEEKLAKKERAKEIASIIVLVLGLALVTFIAIMFFKDFSGLKERTTVRSSVEMKIVSLNTEQSQVEESKNVFIFYNSEQSTDITDHYVVFSTRDNQLMCFRVDAGIYYTLKEDDTIMLKKTTSTLSNIITYSYNGIELELVSEGAIL